ncbi:major facilitator superfamily domain-containing protein, partial [Coniella lustricola]
RGEDGNENENELVYTLDEERAVVRKFDRRLVLFVALLYLLSFLDRSNIGNAFVAGMNEDLLQGTDPLGAAQHRLAVNEDYYEWALTAFYIAYICFEWLSLLWTAIPAHVYITFIVLSWGVVASLQAVVSTYPALIRLRFLLGIGEAGFTGIPIYLSFFFKRDELALRTAVFISAAPLATTIASSLAWVITKVGEQGPIAPWRLLFLIEGCPAVLVATIAWRIIPDSPEQAWYLSTRERKIARQRLQSRGDSPQSQQHTINDKAGKSSHSCLGALKRSCSNLSAVLLSPIPWTTAAIFFLANVAYSSLPVFLPIILTQMGHSPVSAQALAAPPYLLAFFVVLAVAKLSDTLSARAVFIAAAALASAVGYTFLALAHWMSGAMLRYMAIYPAGAGFFCVVVLTMAWNVNNASAAVHKGGAFALMQVIGQCGPLVGTRLYPATDGPWFTRGMGVCAVCMYGVAGLALGLRWYLKRENGRMDREEAGFDEEDGMDREEEAEGLVAGERGTRKRKAESRKGFRYML